MQALDETFEEIKEKYNAQKALSYVDSIGPGHGKVEIIISYYRTIKMHFSTGCNKK